MCTPLTHRLQHYVQNMGERIAFYNLFICAVGWVIFDDLSTSPLKLKCWFCKFIFAHSPSEKIPNHIIIIQLSTNTRTVFLLTHSPGTAQSRPVMSVCILCVQCMHVVCFTEIPGSGQSGRKGGILLPWAMMRE